MFLANKLNKGAGSPAALDAQFNYVTMLLHGDGTNGAQNNTFLDSSTNNFTITRNGNTTQGSFSPYGSNWSNYFDGSGDYLSVANNANLNLGSGNFTLECWIFPTNANGIIWSQWNNGGDNSGYLYLNGTNFQYRIGATEYSFGSFSTNTWTHVAVSRSGSSVYLFVNGSLVSTQTNSTNITTTGATVLGANDSGSGGANFFTGYISNFRQVKGTAVYTSGFTPSTTPLTAVTNTQLLACQSNRFKDNSTNNFTLTVNGNPSVQRFNPFGASTAYSTSVIGGSGYFDGTGDYLTAPDSTALDLSGDFTVEAWVNVNNTSAEYCVFHNHTSNTNGIALTVNSGAPRLLSGNGSWQVLLDSSITIKPNTWNHIAGTRSGNTYTIWVNGVSGGTASNSSTPTYSGGAQIGRLTSGVPIAYIGYMSNLRVVKDTAVYTTTFTPSTTPLTAISGTSLLLSYTNGAIFDNAMMNDLETVGNAQISTSVKKYGTGSLAFDGTGDYLLVPASPNLVFGTGAFTIECWVYRTADASGAIDCVLTNRDSGFAVGQWALYAVGSTIEFDYRASAGSNSIVTASLSNDTWTHIAVVRNGTTYSIYKDGTLAQTKTISASDSVGSTSFNVAVGSATDGSFPFQGYVDDLRITKGYARYTANFTPPTAAFPNIGPV